MPKVTKRIRQALDTVKEVLEKAELTPKPIEGGNGFEAHFAEDGPRVRGVALVLEAEKFVFYFEFKQKATRKTVRATMEYITRANYDLTIGNFELDVDGGLVRYKSSLDFSGVDLSAVLVRNIIVSGIYVLETYSTGLIAVVEGKMSLEKAIEAAEASL